MAIVSYTDEDGVHFTDEFSKTYEKHLKAVAEKGAGRPAETSKPEPVKPVSKPDVKSDLKVS